MRQALRTRLDQRQHGGQKRRTRLVQQHVRRGQIQGKLLSGIDSGDALPAPGILEGRELHGASVSVDRTFRCEAATS